MRAITVEPKKPGTAKWEEVEEPDVRQGSVLVETIAVGVCGTDTEIIEGKYGWPPPSKTRLILGHESLGRVLETEPTGRFKKGDPVVGIVRRPDPVPCPNCAVGEWDMCRNGQYTERGIKQIDGFMSERWRIESEYAMKIDSSLGLLGVLLEPTTVVTKAWEQVDGDRPARLLGSEDCAYNGRRSNRPASGIAGNAARPAMFMFLIGLTLASNLTLCTLWVLRTTPALSPAFDSGPDIIIECTGAGPVISDSIQESANGGVFCLTGIGSGDRSTGVPTAGDIAAEVVLRNNVIVGQRQRQQAALV